MAARSARTTHDLCACHHVSCEMVVSAGSGQFDVLSYYPGGVIRDVQFQGIQESRGVERVNRAAQQAAA